MKGRSVAALAAMVLLLGCASDMVSQNGSFKGSFKPDICHHWRTGDADLCASGDIPAPADTLFVYVKTGDFWADEIAEHIDLGEALKRRIHDAMIPSPLWGRAVCASNDRPTTPSCQFFRIINGFFVFTSRPLASSTSQIDLFPVRACPTTLPTNGIDLRSWRATAMTSSCMNCTLSSGSNS